MNRKTLIQLLTALLAASLVTGCVTQEESETTGGPISHSDQKPDETGTAAEKIADGKFDAWNYRNNPDGLRIVMNTTLVDLPMEGETESPAWPDTYWPTYKDSTNSRWQKTGDYLMDLSPMEKYDAAFNGWDPNSVRDLRPFDATDCSENTFDKGYYDNLGPAAKLVSTTKGNKQTRDAVINGALDDSCNAKADGQCMKDCESVEESSARSRCEKRCDRGGVETWWGLCHAWAPAAILEKEPLHAVTIPTEHGEIVFTVGDLKALYAVIYDRSDSALIGGRCNDHEVKRDETTGRIISDECRDLNAGSFHVALTNLIGLQKRGFVEDRTFDYEVWNQPVKGYTVHNLDEISVAEAHELMNVDTAMPTDCVSGVDVTAGDYCYNKNVDTLYKVSATLDWVTESHASTIAEGAENLARYSRTDRYTYILEVVDGKVVGGEWYGSAIRNHPDFIWLPFRPISGNRHVSVEQVRLLGDMSQTDPTIVPTALPTLVQAASGDINVAIPDKTPAGISSTIEVGDAVTVEEVKVSIDISHTYIGDLFIKLNGPNGQEYILHNKQGGSTVDLQKTFTVRNAGAINGLWTLAVSDHYGVDVGTLNNWRLEFIVGNVPGAAMETVEEFKNDRVIDIPDNTAEGVNSYIDVGPTGTVKGLELTLNIEHTYISDLEITLSKGGVSKVIHNREGGSSDNIERTFSLDEFNGESMTGRWFLKIRDLASRDTGKRLGWSLHVKH
jgi:subtilisin-like proprotein convertase family protein